MKKLKTFTFLFSVLFSAISINGFAQKKLLEEYSQVIAEAKAELDSMMLPGRELQLLAAKKNVQGEFVMDISIHGKGKVLSVFMISNSTGDIQLQNRAKDIVSTVQFNFKMPDAKKYKFEYTFQFKN